MKDKAKLLETGMQWATTTFSEMEAAVTERYKKCQALLTHYLALLERYGKDPKADDLHESANGALQECMAMICEALLLRAMGLADQAEKKQQIQAQLKRMAKKVGGSALHSEILAEATRIARGS